MSASPVRKWWSGLTSLFRGLLIIAGLGAITLLSAWLTVILVIRGREVAVPDLVGLETSEALGLLQQQELNISIQEDKAQHSELVPAGAVLKQTPEAGRLLKQNRKVKVVLSLGPERLTVPDLVGSSIQHARIQVNQSGFRLGNVSYVNCPTEVENRILAQHPPPGRVEFGGRWVDLLVSRGPQEDSYVLSDLIGRPVEQTRYALETRGFRLGYLKYAHYEGLDLGVIIDQSPPAGYPVTRKRIIELTVNR